jgi:hypothetical protein
MRAHICHHHLQDAISLRYAGTGLAQKAESFSVGSRLQGFVVFDLGDDEDRLGHFGVRAALGGDDVASIFLVARP